MIALPLLGLLLATPAPSVPTASNRAVITAFADLFYRQRDVKRAFETYVVPGYIQHNPGVADGRDAAIKALAPMFSDARHSFAVKQILVDGDLAVVHLLAKPSPDARGSAVADFYRLSGGKIVEHWDVLQPVPATSANPHPMF